MAQVKIIASQTREAEHLRVAAYCRVSSDSKDQMHSYAAQIRSYTEEIARHDGWELVDVYADEGLTGTRMDQREDFNRMMADCRKGKIDRILVKSVSRFARNTKDCLSALRELSAMGVSVRFEKENIDTKTLTTELMVSVSGSLAQQESISISANQKMSYQRRMERGEFITCTAPYGYRIVNKKDLEIVPEEAATVRWIFDAYLKGRSSGWIAEQLTAKGIPSQSGAECWRETGVRYLLTNEKYIGDALSQKSYSCGFPFVQKRNHGERLQYYTENSHPAIIDRDTFEQVQKKIIKRTKRRAPKSENGEKSIFSDLLYCADCGHKLWYHVNTINKNICFFSCSNYVKDYRGSCPTRHYVRADAIEQVVKLELQRMAQFLRDDEPMFADLLERKSNWEIAEEKKHLEGELQKARMRTETVSRLYKKAFEKNAEGLLSDEGFLQITHEYDVEQLALKAKIPQLREQIAEAERQAANKDKFIAAIRKFMQMDELTAPLLRELIDHIEVYETQGVGKSRTQRITIHYRFVGYIDIPAAPLTSHYISETRQGVAVEYIPA